MSLQQSATWLKWASAIVIGFGLLIALAVLPPAALPVMFLMDLVFWPMDGAQSVAMPEVRLTFAISGGIMTGWGIVLWQLSARLYPREPDLGRSLILTSLGTWFVVDSLGSIIAGAPLNALFNVGFLVLFYWPLRRPQTPVSLSA